MHVFDCVEESSSGSGGGGSGGSGTNGSAHSQHSHTWGKTCSAATTRTKIAPYTIFRVIFVTKQTRTVTHSHVHTHTHLHRSVYTTNTPKNRPHGTRSGVTQSIVLDTDDGILLRKLHTRCILWQNTHTHTHAHIVLPHLLLRRAGGGRGSERVYRRISDKVKQITNTNTMYEHIYANC